MAVQWIAFTQLIPKSVWLFPQGQGGQGPKSVSVCYTHCSAGALQSRDWGGLLGCPGVSWAAGPAMSETESPAIC